MEVDIEVVEESVIYEEEEISLQEVVHHSSPDRQGQQQQHVVQVLQLGTVTLDKDNNEQQFIQVFVQQQQR